MCACNITSTCIIAYDVARLFIHLSFSGKQSYQPLSLWFLSSSSSTFSSDGKCGNPPTHHLPSKQKSDSIAKLYEMDENPERKGWLDKLIGFMEERRTPITACPTISKTPLDLYRLYLYVKERSGFVEVCKVGQFYTRVTAWPHDVTNASLFSLFLVLFSNSHHRSHSHQLSTLIINDIIIINITIVMLSSSFFHNFPTINKFP